MAHDQLLSRLNRRKFIQKTVLAVSGAAVLPAALSGCEPQTEDDPVPSFDPQGDFGFFEGVASFDPVQDKVMLWTRYTPASNEGSSPKVLLELAKDAAFSKLIVSESLSVSAIDDFTIHVDVANLDSNTKYYYRFKNEKTGAASVVGETKTLPAQGEVSDIRFAVVSCANYEKGFFNVYGAVAESDASFVVHLGDYIYESSIGENINFEGKRVHQPPREILTLDDYRDRYRQYRSDSQLQDLHRIKPFICIWDDHEISNNTYKNGAGSHGAADGDFETRKSIAIQVWHEYLFARTNQTEKIYRKFNLGGFADLLMLDTRLIGRDKQLDYSDYIEKETLDEVAFTKDWQTADRSILGKPQFNWLLNEIKSSTKKRQILGNQVLMEKHLIPAELIPIMHKIQSSGNINYEQQLAYYKLTKDLEGIKTKIARGEKVNEEERKRVENVMPYNLDSWDGYPKEREAIFKASVGKKLVSLAGASHNAWYGELTNNNHEKVGVEFAVSSVTSSGLEGIFGDDPLLSSLVEQTNVALIDDVKYLNASQRGFILIKLTESEVSADWQFVKTISEKDTQTLRGNLVTES